MTCKGWNSSLTHRHLDNPTPGSIDIHRDVIDFLKQLVDKHDKRDISETLVTAKLDHFGLRSGPIAIGERAYGVFISCHI